MNKKNVVENFKNLELPFEDFIESEGENVDYLVCTGCGDPIDQMKCSVCFNPISESEDFLCDGVEHICFNCSEVLRKEMDL